MRVCFALIVLAACHSPTEVMVDAPGSSQLPATFSYTPSWDGVQSVDVIGAFGTATDWTAPFVTLTASGGTFTGTAMLPPGQYLYVFHVVGDAAADTKAATFVHYAIDPSSVGFAPCPMASPTYTAAAPNPCGQLTVPQTPPSLFHVRGTIVQDGAPAPAFLVLLEREEPSSHHFFANRVTTAADGTYDLMAAAGSYRIQVQYPQYETMTDAQVAPTTVLRREISTPFPLAGDVAVSSAEVAFHDYAAFAPQPTATLPMPTTFTFGNSAHLATHLAVYGTGMAGKGSEIGDPWFTAPVTTSTSASFSGTFPPGKATEPAVVAGERYFWGVEQTHPADAAGLVWTGQSMVVPLTWN